MSDGAFALTNCRKAILQSIYIPAYFVAFVPGNSQYQATSYKLLTTTYNWAQYGGVELQWGVWPWSKDPSMPGSWKPPPYTALSSMSRHA